MEEHAYGARLTALLEHALHLADDLGALLGIGGVDVEEHCLTAEPLDLAHDPFDVAQRGLAIEMNAEDVQAGARQRKAGGLAESRRRAEREGPAVQLDHRVSSRERWHSIVESPGAMPKTAGIILVGNEILSGKTVDANAAYLCRELRALRSEEHTSELQSLRHLVCRL